MKRLLITASILFTFAFAFAPQPSQAFNQSLSDKLVRDYLEAPYQSNRCIRKKLRKILINLKDRPDYKPVYRYMRDVQAGVFGCGSQCHSAKAPEVRGRIRAAQVAMVNDPNPEIRVFAAVFERVGFELKG